MRGRGVGEGPVTCPAARRGRLCAVLVPAGREREAAGRLAKALGAEAYEPTFMGVRTRKGEALPAERGMLRGCVVVATGDPEALARCCGRLGYRALGPLSRSEAALLGGLGRPGARALPMSFGRKLPGGRFVVEEGPLKGLEGSIARVDRHRRVAEVEATLCGVPVRARAGLELAATEGLQMTQQRA